MNRIGIYVFYNKDGIVYRYVEYLLEQMSICVERLIIVVNGQIDAPFYDKLKKFSSLIVLRDNIDFDAGAYKAVFSDRKLWNIIIQYDEMVLFNSSFFGPLYPMQSVFAAMDEKGTDFWGITSHGELYFDKVKRGRHLQSYFMVIKKKMFVDVNFKIFWDSLGEMRHITEAVSKFEIRFTEYFEALGYRWQAYVNTKYENLDARSTFNPYGYLSHEMLSVHHMPFLKIKPFCSIKHVYRNICEDAARCLAYVERSTEYDTDIIWEYLLTQVNSYDLYRGLHLRYLLSENEIYPYHSLEKTIIIVYGHREEKENILQEINDADVIFVSRDGIIEYQLIERKNIEDISKIKAVLAMVWEGKKFTYLDVEGFIRHIILNLDKLAKVYEYLGFYHDLFNEDSKLAEIKKKSLYRDNILGSQAYRKNIIDCFIGHPRLGMLFVDVNRFISEDVWMDSEYYNVEKVLRCLCLNVPLDLTKPPISSVGIFWCRTKALQNLREQLEWVESAGECPTHGWKCALQYMAQGSGYYSGSLESLEYASMITQNGDSLYRMKKMVADNLLTVIAAVDRPIYIYGAGKTGQKIYQKISSIHREVVGFIISDGQPRNGHIVKPVFYLSQIKQKLESAVVICAIHTEEPPFYDMIKKQLIDLQCYMVLFA